VDPAYLTTNQALDDDLNVGVARCERQVLVDLRAAVAHPHERNVARDDPRRAIVQHLRSGLERVGEALHARSEQLAASQQHDGAYLLEHGAQLALADERADLAHLVVD